MKIVASLIGLVAAAVVVLGGAGVQPSLPASDKPSIILIHGAFADGSGWREVIGQLQNDGYEVTAVQHQVAGLAGDIQTAKRVIDAQKGPVIVVGHSYGGAVMSGAAANNPKVKGLVYIAAFAPDAGETLGELGAKFEPTPLGKALVPDSAGFLYIDRSKFHDVFCKDVPEAEARIMAVTQKPIAAAIFDERAPAPAWKDIPSWFVVAQDDQAINPELERFFAKRMNAHVTDLKASHVAFISQPRAVVKIIEEAAKTAK
jgi:pimeloyl-ACP methyl ester carboxylesterase